MTSKKIITDSRLIMHSSIASNTHGCANALSRRNPGYILICALLASVVTSSLVGVGTLAIAQSDVDPSEGASAAEEYVRIQQVRELRKSERASSTNTLMQQEVLVAPAEVENIPDVDAYKSREQGPQQELPAPQPIN